MAAYTCMLMSTQAACMMTAAARHVLEMLTPYSDENGGPLNIKHVTFVEGRGNIIGDPQLS